MTSYSQLLRDPRWQKKRLEIMQRDEFTCQACFNSQNTLNVHHCYYEKGLMPWDYPDESLVTLCEECHEYETENALDCKKLLSRALGMKGFRADHFNEIAFAFYRAEMGHPDYFAGVVAWVIEDMTFRRTLLKHYDEHMRRKAEARARP